MIIGDLGQLAEIETRRFDPAETAKGTSGRPGSSSPRQLDTRETDSLHLRRAQDAIAEGHARIFLTLRSAFDVGIRTAVDDEAWIERLTWIDSEIQSLADAFLDRWPEGEILFIGDQALTEVRGQVDLRLETDVSRAGPERYLYRLEPTLLRIWMRDEALAPDIAEYLESSEVSHLLTHAERIEFGCVDPNYGDFISILQPGLVFEPAQSASSAKPARASRRPSSTNPQFTPPHRWYAFHPEFENQLGWIACRQGIQAPQGAISNQLGQPPPIRATKVSQLLQPT